ncbi:hypothetical protein TRICI_002751 [Trichomonascus ciferrii]|uniref:Uncharacterized protein n=1 Tax=Trichomonascus ciferrii TaxID=44093 RepID=A0A642VBP4_9ASCO|nr:hypothetical protein TRICI_002751 [Trichomonascus ciferrii]
MAAAGAASRRAPASFNSLYKGSRLVQVVQPEFKDLLSRRKEEYSRPVRQVIYSTPASNHRRDYGLKRAMPKPLDSRYITVDNLDTPYGFTEYNPGSSKSLVRKRLQSLAQSSIPIPRKSKDRPELSPLLYGSSNTQEQKFDPKFLQSLRSEFIQWLQSQSKTLQALYDNPRELERLAQQFLDGTRIGSGSNEPEHAPLGTAGLNYSLPGVVYNQPEGITATRFVPGRRLERNGHVVATAGVVAMSDVGGSVNVNNNWDDKNRIRQNLENFTVKRLKIAPNSGQALLTVQPHSRTNNRPGQLTPRTPTNYVSSSNDSIRTHNESNALYKLINNSLFS